ncbi:hypothetical protein O181_047488 [Austropuccinia psidii MF-1]|uniref:Uncharacterized protein n=1 Tax=Austropuccinia psidii MF-1 TaxID=1389203 RepID=A0A9Q3HJJ9_9BASI|nr:hypothetical protein [Austropuccinia psidii MF-1]
MDVQQSTAWKKFTWAKSRPDDIELLNLVLSLFIVWFNPHRNKLSGKHKILGVILLNCLNIPPHLHDSSAFSIVYVIIPGPNAPTVIKIFNHMRFLIDELLLLRDGFKVPTSQHPLGCQVYLQLLPVCGDLLAIHKVVGFGLPSGLQFFAWCTENSNNLHLMQMGPKRPGFTVLESEKEWKSAKILKGQE